MLLDKINNALPNVLDTNISNPTTFASILGGKYKCKGKSKKTKKQIKRKTTKIKRKSKKVKKTTTTTVL